jgi:hypothetical protein
LFIVKPFNLFGNDAQVMSPIFFNIE